MIPEGFITTLLDRADIVDVVGRYVTLKKGGRNFMACCPFHKEKTPSFSVSPSKQIFKCFGCGKAGNAIGFLMEMERLSFPEAVRRLAGIYGMEVPEDRSPARREAAARAKSLSDFMKEAADFYTASLRETKKAADYLKNREITGETAARFGLGYSPDGWHGLMAVFPGEKYRARELLETGLVLEKNGRRYDAFRDRIMFPIRSPKGTVLGFGARTMKGDEQPKYLNSPETPIYHKGSELYGLYEARAAIIDRGRAIVCEGYMDVIQLSQAGFRETVAALGTSITPEHVKKLFKLADSVYFSFDGDGAGRKAARRALEASLPVIADGQAAHFVLLPPEHDPDSLVKAEGPQGYERQIERSLPLTEFLKSLVCEGRDLVYAEERAKVAAEAKPLVLALKNAPVLRLSLVKDIAALARLQQEDLMAQWGIAPAVRPSVPSPSSSAGGVRFPARDGAWRRGGAGSGWNGWRRRPAPEPRIGVQDVRDRMLQCFLAYPGLLSEFSGQIEDEFVDSPSPAAARILEVWRAGVRPEDEEEAGGDDSGGLNPAALLMRLAQSPESSRYESLLAEELTLETPEEAARLEIRRDFLMLELERIKARLLALGTSGADIEQLRRLVRRRTEVERLIAESAESERAYRRRVEQDARRSAFAAAEAGKADVTYSDNEKVRRLQMELFGQGVVDRARSKEDVRLPQQPLRSATVPQGRAAAPFGASPPAKATPWGRAPGSVPFGARAEALPQPSPSESAVVTPAAAVAPSLSPDGRGAVPEPMRSERRSRRDEIVAALSAQAAARAGRSLDDPELMPAAGPGDFPDADFSGPAVAEPPPALPEDGLDGEALAGLAEEAALASDDLPEADPI